MRLPFAALLATSCSAPVLILASTECTVRSDAVPADWTGPGEAELLIPLDAPMPAVVVWNKTEDGDTATVSVVASRAEGAATLLTRHGNERCDFFPPEIHVPVTFEVDVGDGQASGTLEGSLWATEDDSTVQVSARGPAVLSEAWQALARQALHAGGPVIYQLSLSQTWASGLGQLSVNGSTDSAIAPVGVSGSVWRGIWYDGDTPLPE